MLVLAEVLLLLLLLSDLSQTCLSWLSSTPSFSLSLSSSSLSFASSYSLVLPCALLSPASHLSFLVSHHLPLHPLLLVHSLSTLLPFFTRPFLRFSIPSLLITFLFPSSFLLAFPLHLYLFHLLLLLYFLPGLLFVISLSFPNAAFLPPHLFPFLLPSCFCLMPSFTLPLLSLSLSSSLSSSFSLLTHFLFSLSSSASFTVISPF